MKPSLIILALAVSMAAGFDFSQLRKMDDISREEMSALVESMDDLVESEGAMAEPSDENMNVLVGSLFADEQTMGMLLTQLGILHVSLVCIHESMLDLARDHVKSLIFI